MYYNYYQDPNYLQHYGRKGMKWYQNIYQTMTSASRRRRRKAVQKEQARRQRFNQTKKQKIISSGDLKKAYKNRKYFTTEELKRLNERSKEIAMLQNRTNTSAKSNAEPIKKAQTIQEKKQKTIQNVDLKTAYRNRQYFTTKELTDLANRAQATSKIKGYLDKESSKNSAKKLMQNLGKDGEKYIKTMESVYKFYNTLKKNKKRK